MYKFTYINQDGSVNTKTFKAINAAIACRIARTFCDRMNVRLSLVVKS